MSNELRLQPFKEADWDKWQADGCPVVSFYMPLLIVDTEGNVEAFVGGKTTKDIPPPRMESVMFFGKNVPVETQERVTAELQQSFGAKD